MECPEFLRFVFPFVAVLAECVQASTMYLVGKPLDELRDIVTPRPPLPSEEGDTNIGVGLEARLLPCRVAVALVVSVVPLAVPAALDALGVGQSLLLAARNLT